ncbi:hypothetical protein CRE_13469 [Caenorhabditis remanei]|uniref:Uncharacterized protein n=1 Tax=Caenorhabditis remanei TaxID=31234 RepID=E3MR61_CAERE|nr:hypothetical protein CRE_13469 [Caenorhabditis remanei]
MLRLPFWQGLLLSLLVISTQSQQPQQSPPQQNEDRCQDRSCYPITGNLLIGRKSQLKASSTCGTQGRQRFCIVSHLEEQTKCFYCDSRTEWKPQREPYRLSHRIENVVTEVMDDKNRNWWQSENGVQNATIQLDLEAEFHFTHLIMTFKSFRPAAMIIERSADFGKTWQIYRYFAYDCDSSFPGIPEGPPKKHTDVICTSQYSDVAPSTGGEIVYKVISPHIVTENPYADEISTLLKITNLRFNFTKLHTLGDDLLDYRPEIDEKYYYAIYEIVVRGSCSCYGHASRCIPIDPHVSPNTVMERADIVHGRCECMHNTEGLNCEKCKAFYNDLPWRPAIGDEKNECRQCNCNRHALRCHFDRAVYEASGFVSGGVCDDCMHNTQGKNCEQCKPFYYRDPRRTIDDPHVCLPCECDKAGSQNKGICEGEEDAERGLVAGKCYCKTNVDGNRCDRCKNGYWNLTETNIDGCVACTCNLLGTYNNEGCDKYTGLCTCKRLVTGENCDQCLPEHYGLSEHVDGCKACDCDIGGSYDNTCEVSTGQCKCREGFSGRRCETADSSFYCADITHYVYEAEYANLTRGEVKTREWPTQTHEQTWTGEGFAQVSEGSIITVNPIVEVSQKYNVIIRHDGARDPVGWENVQITVVRPETEGSGFCADAPPSDDFLIARIYPGSRYIEVQPAICLEAGVQYELRIQFNEKRTNSHPQERAASNILIDSILLAPPTSELHIFQGSARAEQHLTEYNRYQCRHLALSLTLFKDQRNEVCERYVCPVAAALLNKTSECNCDATGSVSGICSVHGGQCECKPNVVGRRCEQCAIGTYGFGPTGCKKCDCDAVGSLGNDCDKQSGQCVCREKGIYGRQCNQCQPGFWGFPECRTCQCNDHANICDQTSGACIECRDLTTGHYCDRCQDGYYGDPRLGVGIPCKPCPCPGGPTSGYQHADTCYLRNSGNNTQDIVCNCKSGYQGERCGECAQNHWGSPREVGGTCERCDCNGNIDMSMEGSCDAATGECLKCLHHTEGAQCEHCVDGYYGDAKLKTCQRCVCNELGTNTTKGACDRVSGQCPCHDNVIGMQCDQCAENHFNLASGAGCEACGCDPNGVVPNHEGVPHLQCNIFDGQCQCKPGRGGRKCDQCEDLYWGDPTTPDGCHRCECNPTGSKSLQCHRNNGTCECQPGSGGALCNECARGYTGQWPYCNPCGECFHQWDNIMQKLQKQVHALIDTANNIEDTGVASAYDADFEKMEETLKETKKTLADANISKEDIEEMSKKLALLKKQVIAGREKLGAIETRISNVTQAVDFAQKDLEHLQKESERVEKATIELEDKASKIKEADVLGAFNITRESGAKSMDAQRRTDAAIGKLAAAESQALRASELLEKNKNDFEKQYLENEAALNEAETLLSSLESYLPRLNEQVCGASSAPCDALCGGPGSCGFCGGQSCMEGAVSKANQAKSFATEADTRLDEKQKEAEEVLAIVRDVLTETTKAKAEAEKAYEVAKSTAQRANNSRAGLEKINDEIQEFVNGQRSTPEQIRNLAEEVLAKKISLTPDQITDLTGKIRESLAKINNIDEILNETRGNKSIAANLEARAAHANKQAEDLQKAMEEIREGLQLAEQAHNNVTIALEEIEKLQIQAREAIDKSLNSTAKIEEKAQTANTTLTELEGVMSGVKVEYLQISESAKNALTTVDAALAAATNAEQKNKQIQVSIRRSDLERANELLEKRMEGNVAPQQRAEKLRERAAKLLYQAQRHNDDIDSKLHKKKNISRINIIPDLSKDSTEMRLDDYEAILADLHSRLERVTQDIHDKTDFHATCG